MNKIQKIGMVVAMNKEIMPIISAFSDMMKEEKVCGYTIKIYNAGNKQLYITESGVGEICAAGATALLIGKYGVDAVLNFGVCGALTGSREICSVVVVNGVVHYDFDLSQIDGVPVGVYPEHETPIIKIDRFDDFIKQISPDLKSVVCASADKFIADSETKKRLNKDFSAEVCDMECAGIAVVCENAGVPLLVLKAVSDGEGGVDDYLTNVKAAVKVYVSLVKNIIEKL